MQRVVRLDTRQDRVSFHAVFDGVVDAADGVQAARRRAQAEADPRVLHRRQFVPRVPARVVAVACVAAVPRAPVVAAGSEEEVTEHRGGRVLERRPHEAAVEVGRHRDVRLGRAVLDRVRVVHRRNQHEHRACAAHACPRRRAHALRALARVVLARLGHQVGQRGADDVGQRRQLALVQQRVAQQAE